MVASLCCRQQVSVRVRAGAFDNKWRTDMAKDSKTQTKFVTFPPSRVYHLAGLYVDYTFCGQWLNDIEKALRGGNDG